MSQLPSTAFKVLTAAQFAAWLASGSFAGAPVDLADGYIHLSTAEQLQGTLDKHFAGQQGMVIAEVDLAMLADAVRWEPSRGGALFPHVYAALPLASLRLRRPGLDPGSGCLLRRSSRKASPRVKPGVTTQVIEANCAT